MYSKVLFAFLLSCIVTFQPANPASAASAPSQFDEDVAQCRRVVREYCAVVQQMGKEPQLDKNKQEKALVLLRDARDTWKVIQRKYGESPPAEYASDTSFKARLHNFTHALEDMERTLAVGQVRRSFVSCGFGCGLFVTMHEENELTYGLDALFHLRKFVKTAGAVMKSRGLESVQGLLPALMQKRDMVILAPLPWPDKDKRLQSYVETVGQCSQMIDDLVRSVTSGHKTEAETQIKELTELVNSAYGLAL